MSLPYRSVITQLNELNQVYYTNSNNIPVMQSVVPGVVSMQPVRQIPTYTSVTPIIGTSTPILPTYQQVMFQQPIQQPTPATNNNGLMQVSGGLCQMLTEQKIQSTMKKKKNTQQKVSVPTINDDNIPSSGLIEVMTYAGTDTHYPLYTKTEKLIAEYKQALFGVYQTYILSNPNNRELNNKFMFFSKTLTDSLFDAIKAYQKCYRFCDLQNKKLTYNDQYKNLFEENDEKNLLASGPLEMNCNSAIKKASQLLRAELNKINKRAQELICASADHLFSSNHKGDSVDDMAADDCVFNISNISRLFPETVFSDNTAKDTFLEKLSIDDEEELKTTHFICDISTFTDALLAAAESTFDEYSNPDGNQQLCVANCIKNAMDVATAGWQRYQILFKQSKIMDKEQKDIVHDNYKKIFTKIQQCKDKYNAYLEDKLRDEENKTERNKIQKLMNKNNNVKIQPPKEIGRINNNVSMVGLNYNNLIYQGDLFK